MGESQRREIIRLAGLGAAGAALATLVNVCIFLAYGTTSAVARRMGAGDQPGAVRHGIDGMWVALLLGAVIAAVAVPLAGPIAGAFGASAAATGYAVTYLQISAAGVPAMLLVLAGTPSPAFAADADREQTMSGRSKDRSRSPGGPPRARSGAPGGIGSTM